MPLFASSVWLLLCGESSKYEGRRKDEEESMNSDHGSGWVELSWREERRYRSYHIQLLALEKVRHDQKGRKEQWITQMSCQRKGLSPQQQGLKSEFLLPSSKLNRAHILIVRSHRHKINPVFYHHTHTYTRIYLSTWINKNKQINK